MDHIDEMRGHGESSAASKAAKAKMREIDADLCVNCRKRPATMDWVGRGSVMDYIHGFSQRWCEYCATVEQIKFAEEMAANLPELRKKLEGLE